jgi:predicted MarR family transcription regulator
MMRVPVVSSAHLAGNGFAAMSEFEFSINLAATAYQRWIVRCAAAAGQTLSALEILIVHTVRHRDRPKRLADITLVLDIEDVHLATYALRKLAKLGLLASSKEGKENLFFATEAGFAFCERYAEVRTQLLVGDGVASAHDEQQLSELASLLRTLSGQYNQAARAAATL